MVVGDGGGGGVGALVGVLVGDHVATRVARVDNGCIVAKVPVIVRDLGVCDGGGGGEGDGVAGVGLVNYVVEAHGGMDLGDVDLLLRGGSGSVVVGDGGGSGVSALVGVLVGDHVVTHVSGLPVIEVPVIVRDLAVHDGGGGEGDGVAGVGLVDYVGEAHGGMDLGDVDLLLRGGSGSVVVGDGGGSGVSALVGVLVGDRVVTHVSGLAVIEVPVIVRDLAVHDGGGGEGDGVAGVGLVDYVGEAHGGMDLGDV